MQNKNHYLITLVRSNGSRDIYIPSLEREENAACMTSSEFVKTTLLPLLGNDLEIDFQSEPDQFGIVAVNCDVQAAAIIQAQTSLVASVLNIHASCTSDPWDLLPNLEDDNTQRAFAELRNERRFQKDVESAWSSTSRSQLRDICGDLVDLDTYRMHFNLPAIGKYLGLSVEELSQYMIIGPEHLSEEFPSNKTPDNVINRARALVLIAFRLRKLFGPCARATDWMLRKPAEGWHHNGLSAKDCLLNGYYLPVFMHLTEVTRKPDRPICGGTHRCSHDFFGASRRF